MQWLHYLCPIIYAQVCNACNCAIVTPILILTLYHANTMFRSEVATEIVYVSMLYTSTLTSLCTFSIHSLYIHILCNSPCKLSTTYSSASIKTWYTQVYTFRPYLKYSPADHVENRALEGGFLGLKPAVPGKRLKHSTTYHLRLLKNKL